MDAPVQKNSKFEARKSFVFRFARPFAESRLQALPLCVVVIVVTSERFAVHNVHNDAKRQGL